MRSDKRAAVAILTFVLFVFGQASASITGSISGVVRDKSGAVIAGAYGGRDRSPDGGPDHSTDRCQARQNQHPCRLWHLLQRD
jgi:hypothetical protein